MFIKRFKKACVAVLYRVFTSGLWGSPVWTAELEAKKKYNIKVQANYAHSEFIKSLVPQPIVVGSAYTHREYTYVWTETIKRGRIKVSWVRQPNPATPNARERRRMARRHLQVIREATD